MSTPSWARWLIACAGGVALLAAAIIAQAPAPASPTGAQALYDTNCASCHGATGHGDGPAAGMLEPAPRDFTKGIYKFRTTASGSLPSDEDLIRTISEGLPGTSMLGWKGRLTDDQIRQVVTTVKSFSPRFATEAPKPVAFGKPVASTPASVAKGRKLYEDLACGACHGDAGTTEGSLATMMKDDWGKDLRAADLTQPWAFRSGATPDAIYTRLKTGINGTPMPSFVDTAKDADLWDVANFVATLGRKPTWKMSANELTAQFAREKRVAASNPVDRGRYVVQTVGCAHCHTPVDAAGRELPGLAFAGGQKFRLGVWGDFVTANLTSDNETGIGRFSDDDIKRAVTKGIKHDDTRMLPFPMGWPAYASLSPEDLDAMVKYLRTLPPVSNRIPPPARPGFFPYLGMKFQALILGRDYPLVIYPGNAGTPLAAAAAGK